MKPKKFFGANYLRRFVKSRIINIKEPYHDQLNSKLTFVSLTFAQQSRRWAELDEPNGQRWGEQGIQPIAPKVQLSITWRRFSHGWSISRLSQHVSYICISKPTTSATCNWVRTVLSWKEYNHIYPLVHQNSSGALLPNFGVPSRSRKWIPRYEHLIEIGYTY